MCRIKLPKTSVAQRKLPLRVVDLQVANLFHGLTSCTFERQTCLANLGLQSDFACHLSHVEAIADVHLFSRNLQPPCIHETHVSFQASML